MWNIVYVLLSSHKHHQRWLGLSVNGTYTTVPMKGWGKEKHNLHHQHNMPSTYTNRRRRGYSVTIGRVCCKRKKSWPFISHDNRKWMLTVPLCSFLAKLRDHRGCWFLANPCFFPLNLSRYGYRRSTKTSLTQMRNKTPSLTDLIRFVDI